MACGASACFAAGGVGGEVGGGFLCAGGVYWFECVEVGIDVFFEPVAVPGAACEAELFSCEVADADVFQEFVD